MPELPLDNSDAVIVGQVADTQAFVAGAGVYTEHSVVLSEIVKSRRSLTAGKSIVVLRRGGDATLSNGQVRRHLVYGDGEPLQRGGQYLLFLNYHSAADAYYIVKLWVIENGKLKPGSPDDIARASHFASENNGKPLGEVLTTLRGALAKAAQ